MASIRKRGNSYLLVVSMGYTPDGRRRNPQQKTVKPPTGLTPKQTEKWLQEQAMIFEMSCKKMNPDIVQNVFVYLVAYAGIAGLSVLLVSIDDFDFATNFGSVMGTLNNIGPGLGVSGPAGNFAQFSPFSKLVFCMDMLIGRLEIFPFLMLFTSISWRKKF